MTGDERREVRRALRRIAMRRARSGSGSDLAGLRGRPRRRPAWVRVAANDLSVRYAIIGGLAANEYMAPRLTEDLAIAIARSDAAALTDHLKRVGWRRGRALRLEPPLSGWTWTTGGGDEVDVIEIPPRWHPIVDGAQDNRLVDRLPTVSLPWLVVLKLHSSRDVDEGDITRMLGHQSPQMLSAVRRVVRAAGLEDYLEDLDQMIALGQYEHGRQGAERRRVLRR